MNFNVWNIKEMLSIPSGSGITKSSSWNNNQTDDSALSDSQFLFGSQFCPENSEALSVPLEFSAHLRYPKQTQQNSLDSEPSIFTKYQTKPQLFGGDTKDEGLFSLPLPAGKSKGLLKQFEEQKRRATDRCDSEILNQFVSHFGELIQKLQTSLEKSEEHLTSRSQCILESLETVVKTFQETTRVQSDLMIGVVQDKGNMEQAILDIQKKLEARRAEFIEMKSSLKNLEILVAQQSKDFQQLCEKLGQLNVPGVLEELKQLISVPQVPGHVKDSTSQTSPSLTQSLNFIRQGKNTSEEPSTWESQEPPTAMNPSMSSQRSEGFGIWDKGAKNNVLQEVTLPADGPHKGKEHVKDRTMQNNCKNWVITKTSPKNHDSSLPNHKVCGDEDLISQESSQVNLKTFVTRFKNVYPKYQAQSKFSSDPCEQSATEQKKGRSLKGKKKQTRKSCRGKPLGSCQT
ncbi:interactor of HORMAD1 protein 1 isoform X2 [Nannospalax galili]|uniref:interactor of HORMAD1 protein 1 isoform X2 n=1 Tax=Nannospalax galili TaxID=1026970 RepID=UPI00111BD29C|nr:interactor of HORMAD1 protein 1 isoform X2 [Nannospalax galili]